jgi:hypothetical protein
MLPFAKRVCILKVEQGIAESRDASKLHEKPNARRGAAIAGVQ